MEKEKEKKGLYIPVYVPDRQEVVSGYRTQDLMVIGIVSAIAVIVLLIAVMAGSTAIIGYLAVGVVAVGATVIIVRQDRAGENLIDQIKVVWKYRKSQKRYIYHFKDEYMSEEEIYGNEYRTGPVNREEEAWQSKRR